MFIKSHYICIIVGMLDFLSGKEYTYENEITKRISYPICDGYGCDLLFTKWIWNCLGYCRGKVSNVTFAKNKNDLWLL